jgi:2-polyprenyl-3-methyl-5-hydroxy-6-metoxy-1,4-benzoquinol methylase
MEVELKTSTEFDATHPNYERWKRAREISLERGKFVKAVLSNFINCRNLKILDIGSGEGGTSIILAENNFVVSIDKNLIRLKKQINTSSELLILGDATDIPIKEKTFDIIILQDCIEHLSIEKNYVDQFYQLLEENGIIYLSTPNKYSFFNIISDPHWGLPILSLLRREKIKRYFLKHFRKKDHSRDDIAELFSLNDLNKLFGEKFNMTLNTKFAVKELLNGSKGLIWSDFHLKLLGLVRKLYLKKLLVKIANDKKGILNNFITPTYYLILNKKLK